MKVERNRSAIRRVGAIPGMGLLLALFAGSALGVGGIVVDNDPDRVDYGSTTVFSIDVQNVGPVVDSLCTFQIDAHDAFTAVSAVSSPPGWTSGQSGDVITWTADDSTSCILEDSLLTFGWTGTAPALRGIYPFDFDANNGVYIDTFQVRVSSPELDTSTKGSTDLDGDPLRPGDTLRYTIDAVNSGEIDLTGVAVLDTLPTYVTAVSNLGTGVIDDAGPPIVVRWVLGTVSAGSTESVSMDATLDTPIDNGTEIRNRAAISSNELPDFVTPWSSRTIVSAPVLTTSSKSSVDLNGNPLRPTDIIRYTVDATNTGDMNLTSATVRDTLPIEVTGVSNLGSGVIEDAGPPIVVRWDLGTVSTGTTESVSVDATLGTPIDNGTIIRNRAAITSTELPDFLTNNDDRTIVAPDLGTSSKSATDLNGSLVRPTDVIRYSISAVNSGDWELTGATVRDTLPAEVVSVANLGTGVVEDAGPPIVVRWDLGTVAIGATEVVTVDATLDTPIDNGTVVGNRAAISSDERPDFLTNLVNLTIAAPDVTTSNKSSTDLDGDPLRPGDTVRYTLNTVNSGDWELTGATVRDTLPAEFVSVANYGTGVIEDAGPPIVLRWDLGTVGAGVTEVVTVDATLDTPLDDSTAVANRAAVSSDERPDFLTNVSSRMIVSAPVFDTASKNWVDVNGGLIQPGDVFLYTLILPNTGDMNSNGTIVTDVLPTFGVAYVAGSTTLNGSGVADDPGAICPLIAGLTVNGPSSGPGIVEVGESAVVTFEIELLDDIPPGTPVDNSFSWATDEGVSGSVDAPTLYVGGSNHDADLPSPMQASTCDTVSYSIEFEASGIVAFDVYFDFAAGSEFGYITGTTIVTNTGNGATSTSDPHIVGDVWQFNYDGSGPNPGNEAVWDVEPDETLTVSFSMLVESCDPGARTPRVTPYFRNGASAPYSVLTPAASGQIDILEGSMTLTVDPVVPSAAIGDTLLFTVAVGSEGFGDIGTIRLVDVLEPGLLYLASETSPAPISVTTLGDGSTELVWDETVPGLGTILSGSSTELIVGVELIDCFEYDQHLEATWGCDVSPCQTLTTDASVNLILNEPDIAFVMNPDPISIPGCDPGGVDVTFQIINSGGPASDFTLYLNGLSSILDLSGVTGAVYTPGSPDEFYVGDIEEGETVDIQFTVTHNDNCNTPSGSLLFTTTYANSCGDPYTTPYLQSSYSTSSVGTLTVSKTGPVEILNGTTDTWSIDVCYGPGQPADTVFVEDTYPAFLNFTGTASPVPDVGSGAGSASSTWYLLPGDFPPGGGCVTITYDLDTTGGTCGDEGTNNVTASTSLSCGSVVCASNDSDSQLTALDCPGEISSCIPTMLHTVEGADEGTGEVCVPMTYQSQIDFTGAGTGDLTFSKMIYRSQARHGKTLVGYEQVDGTVAPGVARFTVINASGDSCWVDLEPERDGNDELKWDLSPLDELCFSPPLSDFEGVTVIATYDLVSQVPLSYHYEFARFDISGSTSCDGRIQEPVQVTVGRSTMSASASVPSVVERCGTISLPIQVTKSGSYPSFDNVLYVSTEDFELIDDPDDPDYFIPTFSGDLPNVGAPTRISDVGNGSSGYYWLLGDLPAGFAGGTITVPVRKRCEDASTYTRLVYDDRCGNDDNNNIDDNSLVSTSTSTPTLLVAADVSLELTPETYFAESDTAQWTLYLINGGPGAAHKLTVDHGTPGMSLEFIGVELFDQSATPQPDEIDIEFAFDNHSVNYVVNEIPPGETWSTVVTAVLQNCDSPLHVVEGSWGCLGSVCQDGAQLADSGSVAFPPVQVIAAIEDPPEILACASDSLVVTLKNAGAALAREVVFDFELPVGLTYSPGSTRVSIAHESGVTVPDVLIPSGTDADPTISGQTLTWTVADLLSAPYLSPGDTLRIALDVESVPSFAVGELVASGTFANECGGVGYMTPDEVEITGNVLDPVAISFTDRIDPVQLCTIDGSDENDFELVLHSDGGNGTLFGVVQIRNTLPEGLTFVNYSTTISYPTATGQKTRTKNPGTSGSGASGDPQVLSWTLPADAEFAGGDSISVKFRAIHESSLGCTNLNDVNVFRVTGERCPPSMAGGESIVLGPFESPVDVPRPDMAIEIEALDLSGSGGTAPGDTIQISVIRINRGEGPVRDSELALDLDPAELVYLSSTPDRDSQSGAETIWDASLPELAGGERDTVVVQAKIVQNIDPGTVVRLATRWSDLCCTTEVSDQTLLVVGGSPHLDIEKVAAQSVIVPGEYVTYEVLLRNDGEQPMQNVVVLETPNLPGMTYVGSEYDSTHVRFNGTASNPSWIVASTTDGMPSFQPGQAEAWRITYLADSDYDLVGTPAGSGGVGNTISISSAQNLDGIGLTGDDILDSDTEYLPVVVAGTGLDVHKYAIQGIVEPGELVTYILRVTNVGEQDLTDVTVTDAVPAGLTLVETQYDNDVTETSTAPPTYTVASLLARSSEEIALTFRASENPGDMDDPVVNIVTGTGLDEGGNAVPAEPDSSFLALGALAPALDVSKVSTSGAVVPGEPITYLIQVENTGNAELFDLTVVDTPPAGLTYSVSGFDDTVTLSSTSPLTFAIASLPVGDAELISVTFAVSSDTTGMSDPVVNSVDASGVDPGGGAVNATTAECSLPLQTGDANLEVEKYAVQGLVVPDELITYVLRVTNSGVQALTSVTVTDTVPAGLTFIGSQYEGDRVTETSTSPPTYMVSSLESLAMTEITLTFRASADPDDMDDPVINIVAASGTDESGGPVAADPDSSIVALAPRAGSLDVDKIALSEEVVPGGTVSYLITATNDGESELTDVTIVDTAPAGLAYLSSSFGSDVTLQSTSPLTFAVDTLGVGAFEPITVIFRADETPSNIDDPATNIVNASGTDPGGNAIAAADSVSLSVQPGAAALEARKLSSTGIVIPGEPITYQLRVENTGNRDLFDVTMTEIPPTGFTYQGSEVPQTVTLTGTNPPAFLVDTLRVGESEVVTLTFDVASDTTGMSDPVINRFAAAGEDIEGAAVAPDTSLVSLPLAVEEASLRVQKISLDESVAPGAPVTYLLTATNNGGQDLSNVVLTDVVPTGLTYSHAQYEGDRVTETSTSPPTYEIASLPAQASEQIALTFLTPGDPAAMDDPVVNLLVGNGDGESGQSVPPDTSLVSLPLTTLDSSIEIHKTALSGVFYAGGTGQYLVTVTNTGASDLTSVEVTDVLPADLAYVSSDPAGTEAPSGTVTWTLPDLGMGESHQILLLVSVDAGASGAVTNTASVASDDPGGSSVTDSDSAEVTVVVGGTAVGIQKSPTSGTLVLGGQVTYILSASNPGDQALSSVAIRDPLPDGTSYGGSDFDPARWNLTSTSPEVRWDLIGALLPGHSEQITLILDGSATLSDYDLSGGDTTLVNVATIEANDPQGGSLSDSDSGEVELVNPRGQILLNKSAITGSVVPGEPVMYMLSVTNAGDQSLSGVEIRETDLSAQGLTFTSSSFDAGVFTFSTDGTDLVWSAIAPLDPGDREEVRVTFTAATDLSAIANPLVNTAYVEASDQNGLLVSDSDVAALTVDTPASRISLGKTASRGLVFPGETVDYTLTVTNTGEVGIAGIEIIETDLSSDGLTFIGSHFDESRFTMVPELTWVGQDTLWPGDSEEIRVSYLASENLQDLPASITNVATVSGTDLVGQAVSDEANEELPVGVPFASLNVEKVALQSAVVPGREMVYLITVTNNGDQPLTDVQVSDLVPVGMTYIDSDFDSDGVTFVGSEAAPVWELPNPFPVGGIESIRLVLEADGDPSALADPVRNLARAEGRADDGTLLEDEAAAESPLQLPFSAFEVDKLAVESMIRPGEPVLYHLFVQNRGDTTLEDVVITDEPPAGLTYRSSDYASDRVVFGGDEELPFWTIANLPVGRSEIISVWFDTDPDPAAFDSPVVNRIVGTTHDLAGVLLSDEAGAELPVESAGPALRLEKSALRSTVVPGEPVSYRLRVTNVGAEPVLLVRLEDTVPTGLTYLTSEFDELEVIFEGGDPLVWTHPGTLEPGESFVVVVEFATSADESVLGGFVENRATVTALGASDETAEDSAQVLVPVERRNSAINLQKSASQTVVTPGGTALYTLTVTNTGDQDLFDVRIEDQVPPGLYYRTSGFDGQNVRFVGNDEAPAWMLDRFPKGGIEEITVRFAVDEDARTILDPVVNRAGVAGFDAAGYEVTDEDEDSTPVQLAIPTLDLEKVATRGSVVPGAEITYLLTVFNNGDEDLFDVTITDVSPSGLVYVGSGYDRTHVEENTTESVPTWSIGRLKTGAFEQIRVSFDVPEDVSFGEFVTNDAYAEGSTLFGEAVADSAREVLPLVRLEPAVHVNKSATQGHVTPGEEITYHITVTNTGPSDLRDLIVRELPQSGLVFQRDNYDNLTVSRRPGDELAWTIAELPAGGVEEIRCTFLGAPFLGQEGNQGLIVENTVEVTGTSPDGSEVTDTDTDAVPVQQQNSAIQILKWSDFSGGATFVGNEIAYHLNVINIGDHRLFDVTAMDLLPPELSFVYADLAPASVNPDPGGENGSTITWEIGTLEPREEWEVLLVGRIGTSLRRGASVANRGVVVGTDEFGQTVQDDDTASLRLVVPEVGVEKIANRSRVAPGETITYRVFYTNPGSVDAAEVVVTDALPAGTEYVVDSATDLAVYESRSRTLVASVGRLPAGQVGSFSYQVRVAQDLTNGDCVPNVATIFAADTEPAISDTVWVCLEDSGADLRKSVSRTIAQAGDTLTYTVTWESYGPGVLPDAIVLDAVPDFTTYVPGSAVPAAVFDPGRRELRWELGDVAAGAIGTARYGVVVDGDAPTDARIRNSATLESGIGSPITSNEVVTLVTREAGLQILKQVDRELAQPGDTLRYTLTVGNPSDRPLTEIRVEDVAPPEVRVISASSGAVVAGNRVVWDLGTLVEAETVDLELIAIVEDASSGTVVRNSAVVTSSERLPVPSNEVETLLLYTDLRLIKSANRIQTSIGDVVKYRVELVNGGNATAFGIELDDDLPPGFDYVKGSAELDMPDGSVVSQEPLSGDSHRWAVGDLAPSEKITLVYEALVTSSATGTTHENRVVARFLQVGGDSLEVGPAVAAVEVITPALVITKTTPERQVGMGEIVLYSVRVQNPSETPALGVVVEDRIPVGFQYLPGSARVDGVSAPDPEPGRTARWTLGTVSQGEDRTLSYSLVVGLNARAGVAINEAFAVGVDPLGGELRAGPAEARVNVVPLENPSSVRGWVFQDCDGDGQPDNGSIETSPAAGVSLVLEDGRRVVTDSRGEYFLYPIPAGDHLIRIDERHLPDNIVPQGDRHRFFYALSGGQARVNFGVCIGEIVPEESAGRLQFSKQVDPSGIESIDEPPEPERIIVDDVSFDTGRAKLRSGADGVIAEAISILAQDPRATAVIEGHTDHRPIRTVEFPDNYELSVRRADAVREALVTRGVDRERIQVIGYGPDRPVSSGESPTDLQQNRRTEIVIARSDDDLMPRWRYEPEDVAYEISIAYQGEVPLGDVRVEDFLPSGLRYVAESASIDGLGRSEPESWQVADSLGLTWHLGDLDAEFERTIRYEARVFAMNRDTDLLNRARVTWLDRHGERVSAPIASSPLRLEESSEAQNMDLSSTEIRFDNARATLRPDAEPTLKRFIEMIRSVDPTKIVVQGHTDSRPIRTKSFANNDELSHARAETVVRYLVEVGGFPAELIEAEGMGARRPIASNRTREGRDENRRVEIHIQGRTETWRAAEALPDAGRDIRTTVEVEISPDGSIVIPSVLTATVDAP